MAEQFQDIEELKPKERAGMRWRAMEAFNCAPGHSPTVTTEGLIERGTGQLPSVVRLPALSVTVAPTATAQATARLLRRLADELEGATL